MTNALINTVFVAVLNFGVFDSIGPTAVETLTERVYHQSVENYSFEGELKRASSECSYVFAGNDTINRNRTIQMIKQKVFAEKTKEFNERNEREKLRDKQYYENIKNESRRKALEDENFQWEPRRFFYKRSPGSNGSHRRRFPSFIENAYADHSNCSSRCIFSRMAVVNSFGFPVESRIIKLIDDTIVNRRFRLRKKKKVSSCFKRMEEVVIGDSCIYSAKMYDCLRFGEIYLWSE